MKSYRIVAEKYNSNPTHTCFSARQKAHKAMKYPFIHIEDIWLFLTEYFDSTYPFHFTTGVRARRGHGDCPPATEIS